MKYSTVNITPITDINGKAAWKVWFQDRPENRTQVTTEPNPLGFYHYPSSMSKIEAFARLKRVMAHAHKEQVLALSESLLRLEELHLE